MNSHEHSVLTCDCVIMVITIQQALRPLLLTSFSIGLSIYPQQQSSISKHYLSILYSLTVWFIYSFVSYFIISFYKGKGIFNNIIDIVTMQSNFFTTIMSVVIGLYHNKKLRMCMKKFAIVDDTLEKIGTPKIYQEMHVWSKRIITGWIIYIIIINFSDIIFWLQIKEISYWGLIISFIINHFLHVNTFVDLLFIIFLWYIGNRFDKVYEHMRCLLVKEDYGLRCTWKKSIVHQYNLCTANYKRVLWTSMHLHRELCLIARELDLIFGKQMTFEMASCLLFLTEMSYYIYNMLMVIQEELMYTWINIVIWTSIFITKLYYINYSCESVSIKANRINGIIHQLTNIMRYSDVHKEIYQFSLQMIHNPLKFSGMGFFYFGNGLLRKIFTTVTTLLIIIIQFKIVL